MSKKAAKPAKEMHSYVTRDIVLGKVRGYPPWPGMIVDPDGVPPLVLKERPTTKKTAFYCVRFFPTGDYAWLVSKDISKLQPHEIQSYINEPYKKSGELLQGYRIALDPVKWEEEREAESRLAAEEEANAEVDQLESENEASGDNDDDDSKAKKTKKRKRESDVTGKKSSKSKRDAAESGKRKSGSAAGKSKKNGRKSNAILESEEDEDGADMDAAADGEDAGPSKKFSPPAKRAKRDKDDDGEDAKGMGDPEAMKVRDWRHKLQKTFLSHKGPPKDEDMPAIDSLFTVVESYDNITIEYLQFSKIGKVMRHIALLPEEKVPRNAEFKFRERADALVKKWHQVLNANKSNGAESSGLTVPTSSSVATLPRAGGVEGGEAVTEGTAAINLNGKAVEGQSASAPSEEQPTAGEVPASTDVAMADAA